MLLTLRQYAQSWISWVVVSFVCLSFAFWGISGYVVSGHRDDAIASVNGQNIEKRAMRLTYDRLVAQIKEQAGDSFKLTPEISNKLQQQALEQLIQSQVLLQHLYQSGFHIAPDDMRSFIFSYPPFQQDNKFSIEKYKQIVDRVFAGENNFLSQLEQSMVTNQFRTGVGQSVIEPQELIERMLLLVNQTRDFSFVKLSRSAFKKDLVIKPEQVQAYYEKHKDDFKQPEQVSISYLLLSGPELEKKLVSQVASDKNALEQYYSAHSDQYKISDRSQIAIILVRLPADGAREAAEKAHAKIQAAADELNKTHDFAQVAKTYSEDLSSAAKGGELPMLDVDRLDPKMAQIIKSLKNGEASSVFQTKYGYQIIKRVAYEPGKTLPLSDVKQRIIPIIAHEQAQEQFSNIKEQLANQSFANPTSLEGASSATGLSIQHSGLFSREGSGNALLANQAVLTAAFSEEVKTLGNNSDVIEISPELLMVLRRDKHIPESQLTFNQAREQAREKLAVEMAQKMLQTKTESIVKQATAAKSLNEIKLDKDLQWKTFREIPRTAASDKVDSEVLQQAFDISKAANSGTLSAVNFTNKAGDSIVIVLQGTHDPNPQQLKKLTEQERKYFSDAVVANFGELEYQFILKDLIRGSKITRLEEAPAPPEDVLSMDNKPIPVPVQTLPDK